MKTSKSESTLKFLSHAFVIVLVLTFIFHIILISNANLFFSSDLISFLTGANIVAKGDGKLLFDLETQRAYQSELRNIYQEQTQFYPPDYLNRFYPFRNLPFVALFFSPLFLLEGLTAYKVFSLLNLAFLVTFLFHFKTNFLNKTDLVVLILIPLTFLPVLTGIYSGQLSSLFLLCFYFIYKSLREEKSLLTGILGGILLIKPQYVFAIPFLFLSVKDVKNFTKGLFIAGAVFAAVSVFVSGSSLFGYPQFLWLTEQASLGSGPDEVFTFFGYLRRILNNDYLTLFVNLAVYSSLFYYFIKRRFFKNLEKTMSIIIFATLIFGIHIIENDILLLLIPIFLILNRFRKDTRQFIFVAVCVLIPYLRITIYSSSITVIMMILLTFLLFDKFLFDYGSETK